MTFLLVDAVDSSPESPLGLGYGLGLASQPEPGQEAALVVPFVGRGGIKVAPSAPEVAPSRLSKPAALASFYLQSRPGRTTSVLALRAESFRVGVLEAGTRTLSPLMAGLLAQRQGPLAKSAPKLNPSETLEAAAVFHPVSPGGSPFRCPVDGSRAACWPLVHTRRYLARTRILKPYGTP